MLILLVDCHQEAVKTCNQQDGCKDHGSMFLTKDLDLQIFWLEPIPPCKMRCWPRFCADVVEGQLPPDL